MRIAGPTCCLLIALLPAIARAQEKSPEEKPPAFRQLVEGLLEHIQRVEKHADSLGVPEFPANKEWFNSPPLRFAKELRGKVVVLDFWTYCCINCIHVLPDLAALEKLYAGRPVAFVGVHSAKFDNEKVSENIRQAILRYDILHPVINDDEMLLWRQLGVESWPTLMVVGPGGNLILRVSGEGNRMVLNACIAAALRYYPAEVFRHEPVPVALERGKEKIDSPLRFPAKLAIDPVAKRLYISDSNHHRIVVTDLGGESIETIGTGRIGLDDGPYDRATFHRLQGLALDGKSLYVADAENHALRRVDLERRTVTTLVGDGRQGRDYSGGRRGREQRLSTPWDVVVHDGRVFVAMAGTHQIWEHDIEGGVTRAYSGSGRELNLNDENPLEAAWAQPSGLSIGAGELFIADSESSSVRAIHLESGATRTIAGGDSSEPRNLFAHGDRDGKGDAARLQHPLGVLWLEAKKRVLVADTYNHRLKLVDPADGSTAAWVGSGVAGLRDGEGLECRFAEPSGLALAPDGKEVFVADTNNHAIRVVHLESRRVRTLRLRGVPPARDPLPPRSQRLADLPGAPTVRGEPLRLAPGGAGRIIVKLALPAGHHYARGAGSRWQILHDGDAPVLVEEERASGSLEEAATLEIPVTAGPEKRSGAVRLEALAYFCRDDAACRVGAVLVEIPVEIGSGTRTAVTVEHRFGDD